MCDAMVMLPRRGKPASTDNEVCEDNEAEEMVEMISEEERKRSRARKKGAMEEEEWKSWMYLNEACEGENRIVTDIEFTFAKTIQ